MRGKEQFRPYIGVTGFMSLDEVEDVLTAVPQSPSHDLMVGILVSSKTLAGKTNKWPGRYPKKEDVAGIFPNHPNTLNLIHYNTDTPDRLVKELLDLTELGGDNLDGFQLNVKWPSEAHIEAYKDVYPNSVIVLQVGRGAMEETYNLLEPLTMKLAHYDGIIDAVLIDPSGGKGESLDIAMADAYLEAIYKKGFAIKCGIAGGLCSATVPSINPLLAKYPGLSMDAEGQLRTPQPEDKLALWKAHEYVCMGYIETVAHCKT